jgi:hypothetical protein
MVLVIAAIATSFDGPQLREFLLPLAQNLRLDATQLAHFTDGEIAFSRYGWERTVHERQQLAWKTS